MKYEIGLFGYYIKNYFLFVKFLENFQKDCTFIRDTRVVAGTEN